jgi:ribosomal protein S18 acetylase RimI-like enzyme
LYVQKNERKGYKVNKIGYIYNFGVDESFRHKGIGKKLVESAIDYFKNNGCEAVDLNVFMFNSGALEFYKSLGFEVIDVNLRKML